MSRTNGLPWIAIAGFGTVAFLAALSVTAATRGPGPNSTVSVLAPVIESATSDITASVVLIVALLTQSRAGHAAAVAWLTYQALVAGAGFVDGRTPELAGLARAAVVVATLVVLGLDWRRYWRRSGRPSPGRLLAGLDRDLILIYAVLAIAGVYLSGWVIFEATVGPFFRSRAPGELWLAAGLAILGLAGGAALLTIRALPAALAAFGGLIVTAIVAAGEVGSDHPFPAPVTALGLTVLSVLGIGLLARWGSRSGTA
jgi:hypothetical protein